MLSGTCSTTNGIAEFSPLIRELNRLYRTLPALHVHDCDASGFEWIDVQAEEESVYSYLRFGNAGDSPVVVVCNFAPVERDNWRIGLPSGGRLTQVLNSDSGHFGGGDRGLVDSIKVENVEWNNRPRSAVFTLPPLTTLIFTLDEA